MKKKLTSEKRNNLDALAETLNGLTINNAGYYESYSENVNEEKGDPANDTKVATNTSDRNKRKVTDTRNRYLTTKIIE